MKLVWQLSVVTVFSCMISAGAAHAKAPGIVWQKDGRAQELKFMPNGRASNGAEDLIHNEVRTGIYNMCYSGKAKEVCQLIEAAIDQDNSGADAYKLERCENKVRRELEFKVTYPGMRKQGDNGIRSIPKCHTGGSIADELDQD